MSKPNDQKQQNQQPTRRGSGIYGKDAPDQIHCRHCKTLMENGVCPSCGYKIYVPMDEKKSAKIKIALAVVLMVVFVVIMFIKQFKG